MLYKYISTRPFIKAQQLAVQILCIISNVKVLDFVLFIFTQKNTTGN